MAIKLRQEEQIHGTAKIHWTAYFYSLVWAFIMFIVILGALGSSNASGAPKGFTVFIDLIIGFAPLTISYIKNKSKIYVVTNERLYVEEGVLSKSKTDLPTVKINDISFSQGLIQRIFGAGNVSVMTGNDKEIKIKHIAQPEQFRETLSHVCSGKKAV